MRLQCNKCGHQWDEAVRDSALMVQCPECFGAVPLKVARPAASAVPHEAEASTVVAPPAPRPASPARPVISPEDLPPTQPMGNLVPRPGAPAATATPPPGDIHAAETIIEPMGFKPPSDLAHADTISPFEQTAPAEDSLFESRDTLFEGGTQAASTAACAPAGSPAAAHGRPPRRETGDAPRPDSEPTKAFSMASAKEVDLTGQTVGGYRVIKMLGAGGMGAVCLARQVSLDRDVALKILPGRLAQNPEFLVRFTREALSAAQLSHHNIIQVYDVGSAGDVHYISMEYVRGDNLGNMVRRDGALRVEDAASFVLQAARGLKYAHDHGIIHRDIKPDNLMVNEHGIVKIADMGLAKMRGVAEQTLRSDDSTPSILARARGDLTMMDVAMGTPAYMSPEQARDASSVDHRADQYSLGCTLYYLVAGHAPYSGSTAYEIISQHLDAPPPNLEEQVRNVPAALAAIVRRMLAKDPDDRYPDMAGVIHDLEAVLGLEAEKGPYTPRQHHLELLEREQIRYESVPSLKWRKLAPMAFFTLTALAAVAAVFTGELALAGGVVGLMVMTPLASFVVGGITRRTYLFRRVRSAVLGMSVKEWLATAAALLLAAALLYALNLIWWWLMFAAVAAGVAGAYQIGIVGRVERERANSLGAVQEMLKHLRLRGVSEEAIQDFVCRFSGEKWEEMFEALFGYEAMVEARARSAATEHLTPHKRFATWRDPIVRWLDGVEENRRVRREKRELARVEAKRLKAQGASEREARRRAKAAAGRMHDDIKSVTRKGAAARTQERPESAPRPKRVTFDPNAADNFFRGARFVAGAGVVLYFVCYLCGRIAPPSLQPLMERVVALPLPDGLGHMLKTYWGGAAGVALLVSAFSVRRVTGILTALGGLAILGAENLYGPLSGLFESQAQLLTLGAVLMAIGLGVAILAKLTGRQF